MNSGGADGLMGTILSLTAPPALGNVERGKGDKNSGQKKAGRAPPKEVYCEGCGDYGDVILTCSQCSITYHPICDDPPLDEAKVKDLEWQCNACRSKMPLVGFKGDDDSEDESAENDKDDVVYNIFGKSDTESDKEKDSADLKDTRKAEAANVKLVKKVSKQEARRKAKKLRNLLKNVVAVAKTKNPTCFELPQSLLVNPYNFPGTSRSSIKKPPGVKVKPIIQDLENFCVPRPVNICFKCNKSCRTSPLLACDYCENQYHFDCVTPPLTTPPIGLWMCPLHPEPFLEAKLLKSSRLSERVKLWDSIRHQPDRNSVCMKFLTKCSRRNPPFARKIPWPRLEPGSIIDAELQEVSMSNFQRIIPFMDKARLGQHSDTEKKKHLYKCYEDSLEEFNCSHFEYPGFGNNEIFSKLGLPKAKLDFDEEFGPKFEDHAGDEATSDDHKFKRPFPRKKKRPACGFDLILQAAEIPRQPLKTNGVEISGFQLASHPENHSRPPLIEIIVLNVGRRLVMYHPQVFFGTEFDPACDATFIDLTKLMNCNRTSKQHAILFRDRIRKKWEILNYSKYGLSVDGVRYVVKPKTRKAPKPNPLQVIKEDILHRRKILIEKQSKSLPRRPRQEECPCYEHELSRCIHTVENEGSSPVQEGSQIQIGCLKMIVVKIHETPKS